VPSLRRDTLSVFGAGVVTRAGYYPDWAQWRSYGRDRARARARKGHYRPLPVVTVEAPPVPSEPRAYTHEYETEGAE
jgi:hypothetical protein